MPGRIKCQIDLAVAAANVDFAVETATENFNIKKEIFTILDQAAPAHAILASKTSSLSVT